MQQLYFIRHGESEANALGKCAGQSDSPLTETGINQAKQAGKDLLETKTKIDIIVSSPLSRALSTAKNIAQIINYPSEDIIINSDIVERFCGDFQGQASPDWPNLTEQDIDKYHIETESEMTKRAKNFINYLHSLGNQNILITSHDQFGRTLLATLQNIPKDIGMELPNAKVIKL